MSNNIEEILEKIDPDTLGEILLDKSETIKHSDYNLIILKIKFSDFFQKIDLLYLTKFLQNFDHCVSIQLTVL